MCVKKDYAYFASELRNEDTRERTRLKANAHRNPFTLNPGTIAETNKTRAAFITKVKSQKVKILIGRVKIINIGLTKVFRTPSATATIIAVTKFSTFTPGKT